MQPLVTERLCLRQFYAGDVDEFTALNQDPEVMRYFPAPLSGAESRALLQRFTDHHHRYGFGMLAIESHAGIPFLGFAGLGVVSFDAPFTPCVELVWRLARKYWGRGIATEAALALKKHAFEHLCLKEVVAFTAKDNIRSIRVMDRIDMRYVMDFEHPRLPSDHWLSRHVLYSSTARMHVVTPEFGSVEPNSGNETVPV